VKVGDIVKVKVMDVDEKRKRINLTMCLKNTAGETKRPADKQNVSTKKVAKQKEPETTAMGAALLAALKK